MSASVPSIGRLPRQRRYGQVDLWGLVANLEYMLRVRRERRALRGLDPRLLKDLGLSQEMVERESSRSFRDVPVNRPDARW